MKKLVGNMKNSMREVDGMKKRFTHPHQRDFINNNRRETGNNHPANTTQTLDKKTNDTNTNTKQDNVGMFNELVKQIAKSVESNNNMMMNMKNIIENAK